MFHSHLQVLELSFCRTGLLRDEKPGKFCIKSVKDKDISRLHSALQRVLWHRCEENIFWSGFLRQHYARLTVKKVKVLAKVLPRMTLNKVSVPGFINWHFYFIRTFLFQILTPLLLWFFHSNSLLRVIVNLINRWQSHTFLRVRDSVTEFPGQWANTEKNLLHDSNSINSLEQINRPVSSLNLNQVHVANPFLKNFFGKDIPFTLLQALHSFLLISNLKKIYMY